MPFYGTAQYFVLLDDAGRIPWLERGGGVVVEPVPYAGSSHVQFAGRSSPTLTLSISVTSDADWAALEAYLGDGVPRVLADPFGIGTSFDDMCLTALVGRRLGWMADWEGTATFVQITR